MKIYLFYEGKMVSQEELSLSGWSLQYWDKFRISLERFGGGIGETSQGVPTITIYFGLLTAKVFCSDFRNKLFLFHLASLPHLRSGSVKRFYIYLVSGLGLPVSLPFSLLSCLFGLSNLVPPVRVFERKPRLSTCSHPYTLAIPRCRTKSYTDSFFPRAASLWNSLPGACFPPSYDLSCFKRNLNSHLQLLWVYLLLYFSVIVALYLEWLLALFGVNMQKKKINKKYPENLFPLIDTP